MAQITIFHTSDMHNKLTPECAERLRQLKESVPGSLMLDSGDAIWSGNIYWRPGGEPILNMMNNIPYDALCMGNREYHFLGIGVSSKVSKANFPILSANMRASRDNLEMLTHPYVVFEREGVKVGVMGLTVPCITEKMLVKKLSDYYFVQPIEAAIELVPKLKQEVDVLVALTHIGIKNDRLLAESVSGIDVILGGHTHMVTPETEKVRETYILHHGFFVHYVGKVGIEIESGKIKLTDELIPLEKA